MSKPFALSDNAETTAFTMDPRNLDKLKEYEIIRAEMVELQLELAEK